MKRFYRNAAIAALGDGFTVLLDDRPLRTPGRTPFVVPRDTLAQAVAGEWNAQEEDIDPRQMRLTGLSNAAIDRIGPDRASFAKGLAEYGESDLLCYRAEAPPALVALQEAAWGPLLAWAMRRYDVNFTVVSGIIHRPQPQATLDRLRGAVAGLDAFRLAALSPIVTITGSLVAALALVERAFTPESVWDAATVDERWQAEQWGEDALAAQALAAKRLDYDAGVRLLALLE